MRESTFNTEITNSLKEQGAFAYKIADQPTSWTMSKTRFTPDKPCDIICLYRGTGVLIECKMSKKFEAFGLRHLRPSQLKAMDEAVAKGSRAFVFLNIRFRPENRLLIFEWSPEFKARITESSIKAKEIAEIYFIKGAKKRFDLDGFLGSLDG